MAPSELRNLLPAECTALIWTSAPVIAVTAFNDSDSRRDVFLARISLEAFIDITAAKLRITWRVESRMDHFRLKSECTGWTYGPVIILGEHKPALFGGLSSLGRWRAHGLGGTAHMLQRL